MHVVVVVEINITSSLMNINKFLAWEVVAALGDEDPSDGVDDGGFSFFNVIAKAPWSRFCVREVFSKV